jgi:hypothetical protein
MGSSFEFLGCFCSSYDVCEKRETENENEDDACLRYGDQQPNGPRVFFFPLLDMCDMCCATLPYITRVFLISSARDQDY